jgi:hypothetical protein
MGHCCCKEDKTDIPNITVKDLCNDMECVCASSCCMKQQKKHHHHKHHHNKDHHNKDDK